MVLWYHTMSGRRRFGTSWRLRGLLAWRPQSTVKPTSALSTLTCSAPALAAMPAATWRRELHISQFPLFAGGVAHLGTQTLRYRTVPYHCDHKDHTYRGTIPSTAISKPSQANASGSAMAKRPEHQASVYVRYHAHMSIATAHVSPGAQGLPCVQRGRGTGTELPRCTHQRIGEQSLA